MCWVPSVLDVIRGEERKMFQININGIQVLMTKFFGVSDRTSVLAAIPERVERVVFIDTPAMPHLVGTVEELIAKGIEVIVRDHHDAPNPRNPREEEIAAAANRVRELIGSNAIISNRNANPACSGLIDSGEFGPGSTEGIDPEDVYTWGKWGSYQDACIDALGPVTVIVADPDADGLTAAMKACGVTYPELDADADVLDGGRAGQTADKLSAHAFLFVRAMATLPPFDANRPQASEEAKAKLFTDFVSMVQEDSEATTRLQKGVEVYEAGVREAERIAETVIDILPGVAFVNVTSVPRFDLGTLAAKMEARPGVKVTAQRKSQGPIAAKHGGVQISLAVAKASQVEVNLQELLTPGFMSSPETGIISNTTFLLHVSQEVWDSQVLPALQSRFA